MAHLRQKWLDSAHRWPRANRAALDLSHSVKALWQGEVQNVQGFFARNWYSKSPTWGSRLVSTLQGDLFKTLQGDPFENPPDPRHLGDWPSHPMVPGTCIWACVNVQIKKVKVSDAGLDHQIYVAKCLPNTLQIWEPCYFAILFYGCGIFGRHGLACMTDIDQETFLGAFIILSFYFIFIFPLLRWTLCFSLSIICIYETKIKSEILKLLIFLLSLEDSCWALIWWISENPEPESKNYFQTKRKKSVCCQLHSVRKNGVSEYILAFGNTAELAEWGSRACC